MPTCVPIKDMRNTTEFARLVEASSEPVIVTKNGYDQFVVLRSKDYDQLTQAAGKAQIMERIVVAERERNANESLDAFESIQSLRESYDL